MQSEERRIRRRSALWSLGAALLSGSGLLRGSAARADAPSGSSGTGERRPGTPDEVLKAASARLGVAEGEGSDGAIDRALADGADVEAAREELTGEAVRVVKRLAGTGAYDRERLAEVKLIMLDARSGLDGALDRLDDGQISYEAARAEVRGTFSKLLGDLREVPVAGTSAAPA